MRFGAGEFGMARASPPQPDRREDGRAKKFCTALVFRVFPADFRVSYSKYCQYETTNESYAHPLRRRRHAPPGHCRTFL